MQKAHFSKLLGGSELFEFKEEALRYLVSDDSYITLKMKEGEQSSILKLSIENGAVELHCDNENFINQHWNLESPKNLILYIDASKVFLEDTLSFNDLNISGNTSSDITLEVVLRPDELFSGIYRQIVKDHVHERVIPSKPNRLLYYRVATELFKHLVPSINLARISGNHTEGEFVILGKSGQKSKTLYDVREFSSGEKTLFSTLAFLCISKSVCALFIDEPENHFHETLLLEFIAMLHSLCESGGLLEWVKNGDNKIKTEWLEKEYTDHKLGQVVLTTHSKTLIYKIFTLGKNYIVDGVIKEIVYENAENDLREFGLSTIQNQIIFVEGKGDQELLQYIIEKKNILVKPLGSSNEVIETFKKLVSIKSQIRDMEFVFLVDSDNKPEEYFSNLRSLDADFYDKSFIKLNKHEIENYLLDSKVVATTVNIYAGISDDNDKMTDVNEVEEIIFKFARESLPTVYKKETALVLNREVEKIFSEKMWGNKGFDWSSKEVISHQIESNVFDSESVSNMVNALTNSVEQVFNSYKESDQQVLLNRCDGKQVFGKLSAHYSDQLNIKSKVFKKAIYVQASKDPNSEISKLVNEILSRFS
ncbi:AAA family ATPase [Photobacterium damselae subsp. damselae]|nr:AAA family ATPase [Photobacterium damselae subsp. damselae]